MKTTAARHLDLYFSGTVEDKLTTGRQLYSLHGSALLGQEDIVGTLNRLRQCQAMLTSRMATMDMGRRCSACAAKPSGGCCSSYMAANTDAVLLLINLLIGSEVSIQHNNDIECCFLGSKGCTLVIKPIFCLNYNCSHIKNAASTAQMALLEQTAAALLGEQTLLETTLLQRIK